MKHKWHKEIKAWADGAIIQFEYGDGQWQDCADNEPAWILHHNYRIKPQLKEPKYLYVWQDNLHEIKLTTNTPHPLKEYANINFKCIGKIKLESE